MKSALIIGCGYTGTALASRLLAAGWQVTALSREGQALPGASVRRVDLLAGAPDLEGAQGAVVYYLVPPLFRTYEPGSRPHLRPLQQVLDRLRPLAIERLVYASSTSVYGDRGGEWVEEASQPRPDSPWGQMRLDLERLVLRFGRETACPTSVVRLPEIYGPGRGPVQRLRQGYALRHPGRWSNRIHLEDLVDVLERLAGPAAPELLLCSDDEPARAGEVYELAARLLGVRLAEAASEPEDPNRAALGRDSKRCCNKRLRAWLGRPLRYPTYREGLPTTV